MTEQQERVAEFTRDLQQGPEYSDRSIKEIVDGLRPQFQELANKQVELTKTELTPIAKKAGIAIGLLVTGAIFMLLFLWWFFLTGMYIMSAAGFPMWAAAGITTVILLIIGGVLAGAGAASLRTLDPKPRHSIQALQQNVNWLKGQLKR